MAHSTQHTANDTVSSLPQIKWPRSHPLIYGPHLLCMYCDRLPLASSMIHRTAFISHSPHRSLRRFCYCISSYCIGSRRLTQYRFSHVTTSAAALIALALTASALTALALTAHWLSQPSFAALPTSLEVTLRGRVYMDMDIWTHPTRSVPCPIFMHHGDIAERLRSNLRVK